MALFTRSLLVAIWLAVLSDAFIAKRLGTHKRRVKFGRAGKGEVAQITADHQLAEKQGTVSPLADDHMQYKPSSQGIGFTEELYDKEWVKKAMKHSAEVTEPERWAMFSDDGKIRTRPEEVKDPCNMKGINGRLHTFPPAFKHIPIQKEKQPGAQKILCWVFTHAGIHKTRAEACRITWGRRCDGLLFFSDLADPKLPSVTLPDWPKSEDRFDNLWRKMQKTLIEIEEHYSGM
jgi:hypothetical protein